MPVPSTLDAAGQVLWAGVTLFGFLVISFVPPPASLATKYGMAEKERSDWRTARARIRRIYSVYLGLHALSAPIAAALDFLVLSHEGDHAREAELKAREEPKKWQFYAFSIYLTLVCAAASVYVVFAAVILWPQKGRQWWGMATFTVLPGILGICFFVFAVRLGLGVLLLFAFYLACALFAYVALFMLYRRHSGDARAVFILALVAGTMGMIDFLLPAFAFLGARVWEPSFLGRALDSLFYVPLIFPLLYWLDAQPRYAYWPKQTARLYSTVPSTQTDSGSD
jgi:uncharacterized membrane protein